MGRAFFVVRLRSFSPIAVPFHLTLGREFNRFVSFFFERAPYAATSLSTTDNSYCTLPTSQGALMHRQLPLRLKAAASCIVLLMAAVLMPSHHLFGQSPRSSSEADLGASVYASRCVQCHGADGKGDGPASGFLVPRPRDFTSGTYKIRSTESGSIPTDEDLLASIRHGMPGSSMPDWEPFLGGDSLTAVLAYVKSFSPRFAKERPRRSDY